MVFVVYEIRTERSLCSNVGAARLKQQIGIDCQLEFCGCEEEEAEMSCELEQITIHSYQLGSRRLGILRGLLVIKP